LSSFFLNFFFFFFNFNFESDMELGAGCFWGVALAFQLVVHMVRAEVGYSQGPIPDPNYKLVCTETTNHAEEVEVQSGPAQWLG
jgi:peptide methionine sulfoxide reductase MsrA